jgi:hypothetical protein
LPGIGDNKTTGLHPTTKDLLYFRRLLKPRLRRWWKNKLL